MLQFECSSILAPLPSFLIAADRPSSRRRDSRHFLPIPAQWTEAPPSARPHPVPTTTTTSRSLPGFLRTRALASRPPPSRLSARPVTPLCLPGRCPDSQTRVHQRPSLPLPVALPPVLLHLPPPEVPAKALPHAVGLFRRLPLACPLLSHHLFPPPVTGTGSVAPPRRTRDRAPVMEKPIGSTGSKKETPRREVHSGPGQPSSPSLPPSLPPCHPSAPQRGILARSPR
jgi:hypothetical protein